MKFKFNDGGRKDAGYKGTAGDCACRAIVIVTGQLYKDVYDTINIVSQTERITKRKRSKSNARLGVYKQLVRKYLLSLGWKWTPTMFIGQGCKVHLREEELPKIGNILVCVSKHYTAVINGVLNDTFDCSREGMRCVYGYYSK